jgi:hypothetical protein
MIILKWSPRAMIILKWSSRAMIITWKTRTTG